MVALGRVPLTAYPPYMSVQNKGDLGMEFSGLNKKGERVMGVCLLDGIATKINLGKEVYKKIQTANERIDTPNLY